ncbi:ABC transporter substrate-binding protein [Paracoccus shanxieyensis]|uniref:ABC transporter substrate-binding protein n=1 Tax=Paracoccus shanxieyensis TaxID=2675752 RepID=A0A6L6ITP5_9RHOB|nr:ABC transporter substrate-binding protein [Paracoccus shanxieyensis]MTH62981.1 ABC transporter substrate-binding protein [Paracoccus shanxieyensis]MTH85935.1 ABC transporter substrate-binding protein [Paracoccus shanxieyensis]
MFLRPLIAAAVLALAGTAQADVTATDILGRQVSLPEPAHRIVLGEGRHLSVLGLMHDDPVALVAGWRLDKPLDPPTMAAYRQKFPAIDAIRSVGAGNRDLSVEAVIALDPDLVVLTLIDEKDPAMTVARQQLEAAGIPVAYVDFFSHPQENTVPSLRILGALTGAEDRAESFIRFYQERLDRVRQRLADPAIPRPRVFMHVHAAPVNCCSTVGPGVFHDFVTTAGGQNIGAEAVKGVLGNVSLEWLIGADPDFYIATGGAHMRARGGLVLGPQVDAEEAQTSFDALTSAPGFASLRAVQTGHAAGVWHLFNDSPIHIVLIEYLAKTFHPDLFGDVDPMDTMQQIEAKFSPVAVPGAWWVTPQK